WIDKTGLQPWNEPAVAVYARGIASDRPEEALQMAQRFSDTELRETTMIKIGQQWAYHDRAAAEAWFARPGIPEHVRKVSMMAAQPGQAEGMPPTDGS